MYCDFLVLISNEKLFAPSMFCGWQLPLHARPPFACFFECLAFVGMKAKTSPAIENHFRKVLICLSSTVCTPSLTVFNLTGSGSATRQNGVSDYQTCLNSCLVKPNCLGFDFNTAHSCWMHTDYNGMTNDRQYDTTSTQYILKSKCTCNTSNRIKKALYFSAFVMRTCLTLLYIVQLFLTFADIIHENHELIFFQFHEWRLFISRFLRIASSIY